MSLAFFLVAILIIFVGYIIILYNLGVRYKQNIKNSWADISVQLRRRADLIPNLINTVRGYAKHEKKTLDDLTEMRTRVMSDGNQDASIAERVKNENMIEKALKSIFALAENYPDLKANENFLELQRELSDTEDKLQAARRFYNNTVKEYMVYREQFPSNIIATVFGFKEREFFENEDSSIEETPQVNF